MMGEAQKNPYPKETPEWQLWENMESAYAQARSFADDAIRFQERSQAARERADLFKAALERLTPAGVN